MADLAKTNAVKNGNITFSPAAAALTQTIPVTKDERMCIYVKNGSASSINATISKGNGIAGVADLVVAVPATSEMIIGPLESAKYIDTTTGKITLGISVITSVTLAVIQL